MTSPKWKQPPRQGLPEVHGYELLALVAIALLPFPSLALLVVGLWRGSATCITLAVLLALLALAMLWAAAKLRARARAAVPPPTTRAASSSPEKPRGSWPWA